MANDITNARTGSIKNGTMLVGCRVTGFSNDDIYNRYVNNNPTLQNIQNKFENRFDDPSYYYGSNVSLDGGNVS